MPGAGLANVQSCQYSIQGLALPPDVRHVHGRWPELELLPVPGRWIAPPRTDVLQSAGGVFQNWPNRQSQRSGCAAQADLMPAVHAAAVPDVAQSRSVALSTAAYAPAQPFGLAVGLVATAPLVAAPALGRFAVLSEGLCPRTVLAAALANPGALAAIVRIGHFVRSSPLDNCPANCPTAAILPLVG